KDMFEMMHCKVCQTTDSAKFRSLGGEMWKKTVNNNKLSKQAKNTNIDKDAENEVACEENEGTKIELSEAIKMLAKILYEREYVRHEEPIYLFDEIKQLFQKIQLLLKDFFDQICLAARPLERSSQTMDPNYLDSVSTSNEGINMMANLGVTLTARSVNRNKRRTSNAYEKYVGIVDYKLIVRHLDERFIVNLGVPYYFHSQDSKKICSEDELIDRLTVHSYNDRIENKTNNQHIQDSILFDFINNDLKGVVGYMNALRYPSIINVSSDDIYTYKLPSLGYKVSDCHLPQGFVIAKKPSIVAFCDYVHCRNSNYLVDGIVFACGHGYHNHCLQICQFKCLICLEYFNDKIIENINTLMKSLKKKLDEKEPDLEDIGTIVDDNSDNADDVVDDIPEDLLELENAKESFLKIF
ncbi:20419_t:CDS:2, partial [Gigaspora margarita]